MGCCGSHLVSGEEYIRRILQSVELWDTTYSDQKEALLKESSENSLINKTVVKEKIFNPLIRNEETKMLFDLILFQLGENCSIYSVLFYLFPFLSRSHSQSKDFFEIIFHMNSSGTINLDDIKKYLKYYYEFMLISVTDQIRKGLTLSKEVSDENKKQMLAEIEDLRQTVFTFSNIDRTVEDFMELIKEKKEHSKDVDFASVAERSLKFSNMDVRDYFNIKYGEK